MIETNTCQRFQRAFFMSFLWFVSTLFLPDTLSAQCFPDNTKPVARCRNVTVFLDSTGQAGVVPLQVDNGSYDNCNAWYLILEHPCFYCSDIGNKNIILYVQDRAGNQSTCTSVITVKDTSPPKLVLKSSFNAQLAAPAGVVTVSAQQLLNTISDNCSSLNKIQLGMRRAGTGSGFPTAPSMTFTCSDTGRLSVEVWAKDSTGNTISRTTSLQISDANRVCIPVTVPPVPAIMGNVRTESGKAIVAQVTLNGGSSPAPTIVKSSDYNFSNLQRGGNYTLTAQRDTDWLNGVTTLDIALMTKHILDVVPFSSAYKVLAADVNNDGEIDASDILLTRKLVLRQINSIPGNTSWRFIPKNMVLPPVTSSPATNFEQSMRFDNLLDTVRNAHFIAVKTGDVNGTAQNLMNTPVTEIRKNELNFQTQNQNLEAGKTYDIDFEIGDTDASAFQFTLNFDKNIFKIKNIESVVLKDFSGSNFALFNENGMATVSWNGSNLGNLKGSNILKITVQVAQNSSLQDAFWISSDLTKVEAYNELGEATTIKLAFKKQNTEGGDDFALLPNVPNPFSEETQIRFRLPSDSDVELTIFDETGRTVQTINRSFSKGYNELPLLLDTPSVSGIFYCQLKTATHTATKRLVRVK